MDKKEFRKKMTMIRDSLPKSVQDEAPEKCMSHLRSFEEYKNAEIIYIFVSFRSELNTRKMIPEILKDGKRVAVPKVIGKEMIFKEIHSLGDCEPGIWGILEPKENTYLIEEKGMILMPGLGFDTEGHRIGYGGGFYDKYLEKHPDFVKVALAYDEQVVEEIPYEDHDIIVNYLLIPSKLGKIGEI